jgi:hypothetical protein
MCSTSSASATTATTPTVKGGGRRRRPKSSLSGSTKRARTTTIIVSTCGDEVHEDDDNNDQDDTAVAPQAKPRRQKRGPAAAPTVRTMGIPNQLQRILVVRALCDGAHDDKPMLARVRTVLCASVVRAMANVFMATIGELDHQESAFRARVRMYLYTHGKAGTTTNTPEAAAADEYDMLHLMRRRRHRHTAASRRSPAARLLHADTLAVAMCPSVASLVPLYPFATATHRADPGAEPELVDDRQGADASDARAYIAVFDPTSCARTHEEPPCPKPRTCRSVR